MSPWVATPRLSLVATMTLHPVPQNRQAALSHFNSLALRSLTRLAASAGTGIPAAAAAIAAASSLSSWRRSSLVVMRFLPASGSLWRLGRLDGVKDKRGGMHMRQQRDGGEDGAKRAAIWRIDHDDELSPGIAAVDFAARKGHNRGGHRVELFGAGLHDDAGDLAFRRRYQAVGTEDAAGDQGAAVDGGLGKCHVLVLVINFLREGRAVRRLSGRSTRPGRSCRPRPPRRQASSRRSGTGTQKSPCACGALARSYCRWPTYGCSLKIVEWTASGPLPAQT